MKNTSTEVKWYASWFDSIYYHLLYNNRNEEEASDFVDRLFAYINLEKGSKVVDMACGKGRHAKQIAQLGYQTIGLDLSPESIHFAKKYEHCHLHFFVHNMLNNPEHLIKKPDFICNLFTSFGYFDDLESHQNIISEFSACLKPNGLFLFDFMNAKKVISSLVEYEQKTIQGIDFQINRKVEKQTIFKTIRFSDQGESYEFTEQVFGLTKADFSQMFQKAGLNIQACFGDYQLNPFDEHQSPRLIILAKKK
ncbi:MAG: class I SAM-dependent methyltransferase [Flavobacteriales bacterium]